MTATRKNPWYNGLTPEQHHSIEEHARATNDLIRSGSVSDQKRFERTKAALDRSGYGSTWGQSRPFLSDAMRAIARMNPSAKACEKCGAEIQSADQWSDVCPSCFAEGMEKILGAPFWRSGMTPEQIRDAEKVIKRAATGARRRAKRYKNPSRPPMRVQSILFDREMWTASEARAWLLDHGYKAPAVDETDQHFRYRQRAPRKGATYRTIDFGLDKGIKAVVARGGRAKSNPEIIEPPDLGTLGPAALIPPSTYALLGECVSIEFEGKRRARRMIEPRSNSAALLASADAKTLWIVWPSSTRRTRTPKGAEARKAGKLYRQWSKFDPSVSILMGASDRGPRDKIGVVKVIRYRSDKWTGKPTLYEHTFKGRPRAYADSKRSPRMIAVFDPNGSILVTESGIVG